MNEDYKVKDQPKTIHPLLRLIIFLLVVMAMYHGGGWLINSMRSTPEERAIRVQQRYEKQKNELFKNMDQEMAQGHSLAEAIGDTARQLSMGRISRQQAYNEFRHYATVARVSANNLESLLKDLPTAMPNEQKNRLEKAIKKQIAGCYTLASYLENLVNGTSSSKQYDTAMDSIGTSFAEYAVVRSEILDIKPK